jgi:hypothetical protein
MSNHYSAAYLKFPGDDARLDLTDLYVFPTPGAPGRTSLIIDVNPFTTGMSATPPFLMTSQLHPDAVYRINIDNDGDDLAEVAFSFVFSDLVDGRQSGSVYYATGHEARRPEPVGKALVQAAPVGGDDSARPVQAGPCRLFLGVRSDPFFADAEGALHGFQWTGQDAFAGKNVQCMALDVPDSMLGGDPVIGVWATVSVQRDGDLVQVDRGGHPTINPFINPEYAKDEYNAGRPVDDVAAYLQPWSELLQDNGYTPAEATAAARTVLPDILRYDRDRPAAYPNGRGLTDDVFTTRMAFLSNGKVTSGGVAPHADLQPEFPYLGTPNAAQPA